MDSDNKYDRVVEMLRKSEPVMKDPEGFSERVIQKLRREKERPAFLERLSNYLFGWVYVGWIRQSLITVSFVVLLIFVYQQAVILKRINSIDRQAIFSVSQLIPDNPERPESRFLFKKAEYNIPVTSGKLTGRQVDELIDSFIELKGKYKEILKMIEEDPILKNYVEKKLSQKERKKLNL